MASTYAQLWSFLLVAHVDPQEVFDFEAFHILDFQISEVQPVFGQIVKFSFSICKREWTKD
jgi:hypothetical protein